MNEIKIFQNEKFGDVRVAGTSSEPLFCLADVCNALELRQGDVRQRLSDEVVSTQPIIDSLGRGQNANFITEDGLYDVILDSRKPEAKAFRKWVTSEVLPSIRKTGGYVSDATMFIETYFGEIDATAKDFMVKTLESKKALMDQNKQQHEQLQLQAQKVEFFDAVADSKDAVSMNDAAKVLNIKGMGRNNLFEFLREKKVLMQSNKPYQKYIDCGYFRVIEQRYTKNFEECINFKTLIYQRGLDYVRQLIIKDKEK